MPNYSHQTGLFDPVRARPVILMGAGAIGSYIALGLAKSGVPNITVYDYDTVASHNVPMSLYRERDVGKSKVLVLRDIVYDMTGVQLTVINKPYTTEPLRRCSVIMSVDDMDYGRIPIWATVKTELSIDIMIDTRVGAGYGEVYSIVPHVAADIENYDKTLFTNAERTLRTCGNHGVAFISMALASSAVTSLCHFWQTGHHHWQRAFRYDRLEQVL